ncbi:MAG: MBL fold metallo-hydrolase [Acidobacteria bacterium]|nr:MAG: MBL fold metallo-hydrolase [Acidobacteriota bacterium]
MRRVVILGAGNATHADGRAHTSLLAESTAGELLLLDAGATVLHRLRRRRASAFERESLSRLDAVLVTHFHGDHVLGLPLILLHLSIDLRRSRPLAIFGPRGIEEHVRRLQELAYPGFTLGFDLRFVTMTAGPHQLGSVTVTGLPVTHKPESLAYRLTGPAGRTVAYSGDAAFDDLLFEAVRGADLAVLELSLLQQPDPPLPHVSLEEVRRRPGALEARRVVFVHTDDELAAAVRRDGPFEAAEEGAEIAV